MAIIIFGEFFSFPEGAAATNRAHTYAKGFTENNIKVHVITFNNHYMLNGDGITDGIYYYHPFRQKIRSTYFLLRRWHGMIKYFNTIKLINQIKKEEKNVVINCWSVTFSTQLFVFLISRVIKSIMILERSEHPLRNYQGSSLHQFLGKISVYFERQLCDGIFCISQYLIDFYLQKGMDKKKLFHVPSTVDAERFTISYESPFIFQYILYCGTLTIVKDGVNILIESFKKISEKYADIKLVLIGKSDSAENEILLKNMVVEFNLTNRVIFLGQMSRNEIPKYLTNAKILTLARPKSMVADAGFPSKLTEYLSTGIPVVVTEVGEIPVYLKDKENAFLSKPGNVEAFAETLDYVLSNYQFAKDTALKGKELTYTIFNYNFQAKRMIGFINTLIK